MRRIIGICLMAMLATACDSKKFSSTEGPEKTSSGDYKVELVETPPGNVLETDCQRARRREVTVTLAGGSLKVRRSIQTFCSHQVCEDVFNKPFPVDIETLAAPIDLIPPRQIISADRGERTLSISFLNSGGTYPAEEFSPPASPLVYVGSENLFTELFQLPLLNCIESISVSGGKK